MRMGDRERMIYYEWPYKKIAHMNIFKTNKRIAHDDFSACLLVTK